MNLLSAFLLDKIGLICEQIPPEEFEELTECAYEGLENKKISKVLELGSGPLLG